MVHGSSINSRQRRGLWVAGRRGRWVDSCQVSCLRCITHQLEGKIVTCVNSVLALGFWPKFHIYVDDSRGCMYVRVVLEMLLLP